MNHSPVLKSNKAGRSPEKDTSGRCACSCGFDHHAIYTGDNPHALRHMGERAENKNEESVWVTNSRTSSLNGMLTIDNSSLSLIHIYRIG
jgi:hypothetical protein